LAGGGVVAAAVALTIVISGGLLDGASSPPARSTVRGQGQAFAPALKHAAPHRSAITSLAPASGAASGVPAPAGATTSAGVAVTGPFGGALASNTGATGTTSGPRLVHRDSTLTLASSVATMQAVANQIVSATEQQGGVVENSDVNVQGQASYASFSLQVPSGHLAPLIATLSSLASVRALTQSTTDITDGYNVETARLADSVAERAALLKKLATAATTADATAYQKQIDALGHRIAAEHRAIDRLLNQGHTATLQVNVVPGASTKHHAVVAGPLASAFHKALHALQEILAIALIVLAIVLPFALTALALWWSAASLRQRARERAMKAA
jgi:multisubunit Na+/H+ antiporter MnhC subunit